MSDLMVKKAEDSTVLEFTRSLQLNEVTGCVDPNVFVVEHGYCRVSCFAARDKIHGSV